MRNTAILKNYYYYSKVFPIFMPIDLFLSHTEYLSLNIVDGIFKLTTRDTDKKTSCR